jgi:hypothetical protein
MSSPHRHGSKIVLRADGQRLSRKAPITYLSYTSSGPGRFPRQVLSRYVCTSVHFRTRVHIELWFVRP